MQSLKSVIREDSIPKWARQSELLNVKLFKIKHCKKAKIVGIGKYLARKSVKAGDCKVEKGKN